jgi:tRNA modification GTPase
MQSLHLDTQMIDGESQSNEILVTFNKADLLDSMLFEEHKAFWKSLIGECSSREFALSCTVGTGLEQLESGIDGSIQFVLGLNGDSKTNSSDGVLITRERHRRHVRQCVDHLESFLEGQLPMDLAAEEIRLAMQELGKITGRVDVEELLDVIFRDFCIGK